MPYDKKLHFFAGFVLSIIVCLLKGSHVWAIGVALAAGIIKEIRDYLTQKGTVELMDVVATAVGGIAAAIIFNLI